MKRSSWVAACAVFGVLVAPACEIKIGPATSGETTADPTTTTGTGGAGAMWTAEEQAAVWAVRSF